MNIRPYKDNILLTFDTPAEYDEDIDILERSTEMLDDPKIRDICQSLITMIRERAIGSQN